MRSTPATCSTLSPVERQRLSQSVRSHGLKRIMAAGISGHSLARAMAGLPVLTGTVALVQRALDRLEAEDQRLADASRIARESAP